MGHNSVVSGYPKSIGILRVNELSTGPPGLGRHNMIIACAIRWGVAFVGDILYWAWLTLYGKQFRCRVYTGERRSFEAAIVKKANVWL